MPQRVFFSYLRCGKCDAYYCPVFYSEEQLRLLYESQPENLADLPLASRKRTQAGYVDILRRYSRMAGGFLEIGADIGLFAEACAREGRFDRLWLSEANRALRGQLENRLAGQNVTILDTMSPAAAVPSGAISTVVMIHVLDHVLEPRAMLRDLFETLEPGGMLMIVTHNPRSWLARLLGRRWSPFTLQHPALFSPAAMRSLITTSGFEMLSIIRTTNYFPASYLVRVALTVLGLPSKLIPEEFGPEIGFRFGNICTVARRPHRIIG